MSKEVQTKGTNAVSKNLNDWGVPKMSAKDLVIPKILPLQYMSEKVQNEEGKYGEFRDTLSNKLFGDLENPFEVIPIVAEKKFTEYTMVPQKNGGVKREYLGEVKIIEDATSSEYNDDLPLRDESKGIERDRVIDFFVLIPEEIESGYCMPYVLSFRRTSLRAGQKMMTQVYVKNAAAGKVPPATVIQIGGVDKSNDDGSFVVQDVLPTRPSTDAEIAEAFKWFKIIRGGAVKVDDSDVRKQAPEVDLTKQKDF